MKKRVFAIASILTVAVVLTASLSACGAVTESFSPVAVSGEYREQVMGSAAAYDYLEWLGSEDMRSRYGSVDSDELNINYGIGKAAVSLAAEMEKKGYQPVEGVSITVNQEGYLSTHGGSEITGIMSYSTSLQGQSGVNVLYEKPATNGSRGQIYIISHFDNLFGTTTSGATVITAEGAYENSAAVATMLYTAQLLSGVETEYDIVFAFLGSSVISANNNIYYCWDGADALLQTLPSVYGKDYNPVLVINLWRLGGENLYMYSADTATSYNNYFYAVAEADGLDFSAVPDYKHAFSDAFGTYVLAPSPSGVYHPGLLNDSIYFMNEGIPTLTYMSLDWESGNENSNPESLNVAYTGSDTLDNMKLAFGGGDTGTQAITRQLNSVALNIVNSITGENAAMFDSAVSTAREELSSNTDSLYGLSVATTVITWAIVIGLLVAAIVLRGKNVTKMVSRKPPQGPNASNPFTEFNRGGSSGSPFEEFDDNKKGGNNKNSSGGGSGGDDIFEGF